MTSSRLVLFFALLAFAASTKVKRPATRQARAGTYSDLSDVSGCSPSDLGKNSRYYFVENEDIMNEQEFLCDTDLTNDGVTASR